MNKSQFLKIAKVKNINEFYRKFPTEAAFKKAHGKELKKAQLGASISPEIGGAKYGKQIKKAEFGEDYVPERMPNANPQSIASSSFRNTGGGQITQAGASAATAGAAKAAKSGGSGMGSYVGAAQDVIQGISELKGEKNALQLAKQSKLVSDVSLKAAGTRPEQMKRKYVRPEDMAFGTEEMGQSYGTGTNYLARNGSVIGGNPTEIQNTYAPHNTLYSDLGYEPLEDSDQVKQYRRGGLLQAEGGFDFNAFAQGGGSDVAGNLGQSLGSGKGGPNAGSKIGKGVGTAAGTAIGGPIGGMIGGFLGGTVGGLIDGKPRKTARFNEQTQSTMGNIAMGKNVQGLQQGQYSGYMEDGGWMSHDWNPQVIAKFGDHTAEDYYHAGHEGMNSLRAGGHLTNYTPPSERAMETYAMGGELKTLWGGHAEPISQNPYLPGTGETVMFRGQSHDEADGKGRTGIGVKYGEGHPDGYTDYAEYGTDAATNEASVEVERGEPMVELEEGGQIDPATGEAQKAGVVYGNLVLNKQLAEDHGFGKEAGRKMKHIVKDWSKGEAKQNKIIEKSLKMIDDGDDSTAFGQLAFATAKAMNQGANMKLKKYADDKIKLAGIQSALNDTAKEHGVVADDLARGKIKIDKSNNDMAKFGASLEKAQFGKNKFLPFDTYHPGAYLLEEGVPEPVHPGAYQFTTDKPKVNSKGKPVKQTLKPYPLIIPSTRPGEISPDMIPEGTAEARAKDARDAAILAAWKAADPRNDFGDNSGLKHQNLVHSGEAKVPAFTAPPPPKSKKDWTDTAMMAYNEILPYLRPNYKVGQPDFTSEMMAASMNQMDPVQAQLFNPNLTQPYDVSFQDQLNANQADFNALQRTTGYNPAAQSALAAQKYSANSAILAGQFRANQETKAKAYEENRKLLDQAQLGNLGILDKQYERQATAKSKTKQQSIEIAKSISDKLAQQRKEQAMSNIEQQRYNYRFDSNGRPINMNPLATFNMSGSGAGTKPGGYDLEEGKDFTYNKAGKIVGTRSLKKDESKNGTKIKARNGSIVKAIKNL